MVNKTLILCVIIFVIALGIGLVGLNTYTTPPTHTVTTSTTLQSNGYQDSNGQPQGSWADYLGYVPSGYVLSPHYPGAATYPCPVGMDSTQCNSFQASCGNGTCDPNESCSTCPIDCSVPGQLTCDPYTGRAGAPISICQLALNAPGAG